MLTRFLLHPITRYNQLVLLNKERLARLTVNAVLIAELCYLLLNGNTNMFTGRLGPRTGS